MTTFRLLLPTLALLAAAAPVPAQSPAAALPGPAADSAPDALVGLRGERLTPGRWRYLSTVARGEERVELGRRTLSIEATTHDGAAAWRLVDETEARGQRMADTLLVARDDLRPLRRAAAMGPLRLSLDFTPSGARGTMRAPGGGETPLALATAGPVVASAAMLEAVLRLSPLAAGWRGRVVQLGLTPSGVAATPLALAVVGEETVATPAGERAAWVVTATAGGAEQRLWVAKEGGVLLRQRASPPHAADFVYETTLVEAPPAGG